MKKLTIVVVLFLVAASLFAANLMDPYFKILNTGRYHLKTTSTMEFMGVSTSISTELFVDGENIATRASDTEGNIVTNVLILDGYVYTVNDYDRTIMKAELTPEYLEQYGTGAIESQDMVLAGSGREQIGGKTYTYEEYYTSEDQVHSRFYFTGKTLAGFGAADQYGDGLWVFSMMDVLEGSFPASVFELPADYEFIELPTYDYSTGEMDMTAFYQSMGLTEAEINQMNNIMNSMDSGSTEFDMSQLYGSY